MSRQRQVRGEDSSGSCRSLEDEHTGHTQLPLGVAKPDGSGVTVVKMIAGAHPYTVFKEAIDSLLSVEKPVAPKQ
jgi:hypothetical protein